MTKKEMKPDIFDFAEDPTDSPIVRLFQYAVRGGRGTGYHAATSATPSMRNPAELPLLKPTMAQVSTMDVAMPTSRSRATRTRPRLEEAPLPPTPGRFQNFPLTLVFQPGPFEKIYG